jgi:Tetratricopeptide repeat
VSAGSFYLLLKASVLRIYEQGEDIMSHEPNNPSAAEPHLNSAYQLESDGHLERALAECRQAIEVAPGSAEPDNLLGIILERLGQQGEAIEAFRTATELNPDFEDAGENFTAAQSEAESARQGRSGKRIWRSTFLGALIFGFAFLLVAWPMAASSIHRLRDGTYDYGALNALLFCGLLSLAFGASTVVLEIANQRSARLIAYFVASVAGVIIGHMAAGFVIAVINNLVTWPKGPRWMVYVQRLLSQATFGACVGAALGVILPGRSLLRTLVAGAVGFAIGDLVGQLTVDLISPLFSVSNPNVFYPLDFVIAVVMTQVLTGVVGGASLGWSSGAAQASSVESKLAGVNTPVAPPPTEARIRGNKPAKRIALRAIYDRRLGAGSKPRAFSWQC